MRATMTKGRENRHNKSAYWKQWNEGLIKLCCCRGLIQSLARFYGMGWPNGHLITCFAHLSLVFREFRK